MAGINIDINTTGTTTLYTSVEHIDEKSAHNLAEQNKTERK